MTFNTRLTDTPFSDFLKTWRIRRRLSQLDLALASGLSQRHISFLETGKSQPSTMTITQLANALEMPAAEVDAMLLTAGFAARSTRNAWNEATIHAVDASIDHILAGHSPYPAISVDRMWNLKKANEPAMRFFAMIGSSGDINILRGIMTPGDLRNTIVNWEETVQALCRILTLEAARRPHDDDMHTLLSELHQLPGVSEAIKRPYTADPKPVLTIQFKIDTATLNLFSLIATVGMSADAAIDDVRIETLLPADDLTREWFAQHFA